MDTSSEQDKEEKAASEEGKDKRKKVEHDIDEGNIATAAAAALASAATKAKVSIPVRLDHHLQDSDVLKILSPSHDHRVLYKDIQLIRT